LLRSPVILAALVCLCTAVQAMEPIAEIPVSIKRSLPMIPVRVAGVPLSLMFDLGGSSAITLTPNEARRAKVKVDGSLALTANVIGETRSEQTFIADNVAIDRLRLENVSGHIVRCGQYAPPHRGGSIGFSAVSDYLLVIDYPMHRLRLYRSGDADALASECPGPTFAANYSDGIFGSIGETTFGPARLLWDTGASSNLIHPHLLQPTNAHPRTIDGGPPVVDVEHLAIGSTVLPPQRFRVFPFAEPPVDAFLGTPFFLNRKVCFDIPLGKAAIK